MEPSKVYVVKVAFEHDGLSYAEGEKYELVGSLVAGLPVGSVEEFVPEPTPENSVLVQDGGEKMDGVKPATTPAKPWVGGHTVGRE